MKHEYKHKSDPNSYLKIKIQTNIKTSKVQSPNKYKHIQTTKFKIQTIINTTKLQIPKSKIQSNITHIQTKNSTEKKI